MTNPPFSCCQAEVETGCVDEKQCICSSNAICNRIKYHYEHEHYNGCLLCPSLFNDGGKRSDPCNSKCVICNKEYLEIAQSQDNLIKTVKTIIIILLFILIMGIFVIT